MRNAPLIDPTFACYAVEDTLATMMQDLNKTASPTRLTVAIGAGYRFYSIQLSASSTSVPGTYTNISNHL